MAETEELGLEVFVDGWQAFERITKSLGDDVNALAKTMTKLETAVDDLGTSFDKFGKGSKDTGEKVKTAESAASKMASAMGGAFVTAVGQLAADAVRALGEQLQNAIGYMVEFTKESIDLATSFQSSMADLQIAASSTGMSLEELNDIALQVGGDTRLLGVDAVGAASAMTELFKAGMSAEQALGNVNAYMKEGAELGGALRASIDVAAATELDMRGAAELATVAMAGFGDEAKKLGMTIDEYVIYAMDNFVSAANASKSDVSTLGTALVNVGPKATDLGIGINDVNTALAIMSNRGLEGATAGTNLRSMLNNMLRPTEKITDLLDDLNVKLFDSAGRFKGLPVILSELSGAMSGLTQEQRSLAIQTLAGNYGANALSILLKSQEEIVVDNADAIAQMNKELGGIVPPQALEAMQKSLPKATNGWDMMAEAMQNTISVQEQAAIKAETFAMKQEKLSGIIETLRIKIGNMFIPILTELADWASEFIEKHGAQLEAIFQRIADGVQIAGDVLMAFIENLENGQDVFTAIGNTLEASLGPEKMGLIWSALGLLGDYFNAFWETSAGAISTFLEFYYETAPTINELTEKIGAMFAMLTPVIDMAWQMYQTIIQSELSMMLDWIRFSMEVLNMDWEAAWDTFREILQTEWDMISELFKIGLEGVLQMLGYSTEQMVSDLTTSWAIATETVAGIWEYMNEIAAAWWAQINATIETYLVNLFEQMGLNFYAIRNEWREMFNDMIFITNEAWPRIIQYILRGLSEMINLMNIATNALIEGWIRKWNIVLAVTSAVWEGMKSDISKRFEAIKAVIWQHMNGVITFLAGLGIVFVNIGILWIDGMRKGILERAAELIQLITQVVGDALDAVKAMLGLNTSPSTFQSIGMNISSKLGKGIEDKSGDIDRAMKSLGDELMKGISDNGDKTIGKATEIGFDLGDAIAWGFESGLNEGIPEIEAGVDDAVDKAGGVLKSGGKELKDQAEEIATAVTKSLTDLARDMESVAQSFAQLFEKKFISPVSDKAVKELEKQVEGLDKEINSVDNDLRKLSPGLSDYFNQIIDLSEFETTDPTAWANQMIRSVRGGLGRPDLVEDIRRAEELLKKKAELEGEKATATEKLKTEQEIYNELVAEQIKLQEKLLALQEQQQRFGFLESQLKLLELIDQYGLDAQSILGGIQFGADADIGQFLDVTTAAMTQVVNAINANILTRGSVGQTQTPVANVYGATSVYNDNRQFSLSTNTAMQSNQLAMEFSAFEMISR